MPNDESSSIIHSGQFMTSNPHNELHVEDEEDIEVDVENGTPPLVENIIDPHDQENKAYNLQEDEKPITFYKFGPKKAQTIAIDVSLNKLNKCIKIAYMKMTTPKWKDFKGLKLQWKHRIRLNNVIWRAYYMEFRRPDKRRTPYCYFTVPDDDTTHSKIEGTVIEGMYWKRDGICAHYRRWRSFNRHARSAKKKCCKKSFEVSCECRNDGPERPPQSQTSENLSTLDDYFGCEEIDDRFTRSLFDTIDMPFFLPNSKETNQSNNADVIQPGLVPLRPSLEEIMSAFDDDVDSLEPTISMQQPQSSNDSRNGRSLSFNNNYNTSTVPTPSSSFNQKNYTPKNYPPKSYETVEYTQPTRQSSSVPTNGLMSGTPQPLYSQAVYENRATPTTSSLNDSLVGIDLKPKNNPPNINAVNSLTRIDYVPQLLVSTIGQSAQNNIQTFTSMIGHPTQGTSLISPQQQWWINNQIYASSEEKALQMLGSPVSQTVSQNPNGFSTSVLLSLSQASPGIQQSATYSNPYPFSTTNFKAVQQPVLQQIANNQHPTLSLPHEATTISHLQLTQQHQLNIQQQQQDSFQTESSRPLPPQLMVSSNGTVGFQRQFPDLSHYLPQNGGVSAPSVSLASILAGSRSNSVNPTVPKVEAPILTSGKLTSSGTKNGRKVWTGTRNKAGIQTISGNSIDEPLSVQTVFIDQEGIAFKNTPKPLSFLSASSEQHSTSYKLRNNRRRNQEVVPVELSPPESIPSTSRGISTRNKRTRSHVLPDIPSATSASSNFGKRYPLSQPASVQTQYGNDPDVTSALDTPQTDEVISDESVEDRSPLASSFAKRSRSATYDADSTLNSDERKRLLHLNAEKNRREALKDGFDALLQAIPVIEETGIKVTNAVVLNRAAQHIRNLCQRIEEYDKQISDSERRQELLKKRVSIVQSSLPTNVQSSGGQPSSSMSGQVMQFFDRYVRDRCNKDERFVIMASMLRPLVEAFAEQVHGNSAERQQISASTLNWVDNNFKVGLLRPLASQVLIKIATETNLINMGSSNSPALDLENYIKAEVSKLSEFNESG